MKLQGEKGRYYLEGLQEVLTVMSNNPGTELVLRMSGFPSILKGNLKVKNPTVNKEIFIKRLPH